MATASPPTAPSPSKKAMSPTLERMLSAAPATPLDFSFMGLSRLSDMRLHDPVVGKKKSSSNAATDVTSGASPSDVATPAFALPIDPQQQQQQQQQQCPPQPSYSSVSLRVNNNAIDRLDDINSALQEVFQEDACKLSWLDLSGNKLSSIPSNTFAKFPQLFTLHLHGNLIAKYSDIDHLAQNCTHLHSLTLHGNPIEEKKHYRNYVIASFPSLVQLDFSCITRHDRDKALTWKSIHQKQLQSPQKHHLQIPGATQDDGFGNFAHNHAKWRK